MIVERRVLHSVSHFAAGLLPVPVLCSFSSSGPSVLLNTNNKVLIREGLPIQEIIPPLSLPSPPLGTALFCA